MNDDLYQRALVWQHNVRAFSSIVHTRWRYAGIFCSHFFTNCDHVDNCGSWLLGMIEASKRSMSTFMK